MTTPTRATAGRNGRRLSLPLPPGTEPVAPAADGPEPIPMPVEFLQAMGEAAMRDPQFRAAFDGYRMGAKLPPGNLSLSGQLLFVPLPATQ